jgi:hypothetical protein
MPMVMLLARVLLCVAGDPSEVARHCLLGNSAAHTHATGFDGRMGR